MTTRPEPRPSRPHAPAGGNRATFRWSRCGAQRTATTEADYTRIVRVHRDAHSVFGRLNQIKRDGMGSILRVLLADVDLSAELLALIDQQRSRTASPTSR